MQIGSLDRSEILAVTNFKRNLFTLYPQEVVAIYLYGSKARGDFHKSSDIDILIIIRSDDWKTGDRIRRIGYEMDEDIDYKFSIMVIPEKKFQYLQTNQFQFALNIIKDGILL